MFVSNALLSIDDFLPFAFAFHFPFASSIFCCFFFFVSCIVCCVQIGFGRQFRIRLERHLDSLITYAGQVNLVKIVPVCCEASVSVSHSLSLFFLLSSLACFVLLIESICCLKVFFGTTLICLPATQICPFPYVPRRFWGVLFLGTAASWSVHFVPRIDK